MDKGRGRFVWFDLLTRDPEGAVDFYGEVVGWGTEPFEGGGKPYTMWTAPEAGPVGGIMPMQGVAPDDAPPHWLGYLGTDDVDATTERAGALGATVLAPPQDIPTVGRFSLLQDPQGAVVAFFTPLEEAPGHDGPPRHGEAAWHELITTDPDGAWDFYTELFGWEESDTMDMGEHGVYRMFSRPGGETMGGFMRKPEEMPGPPTWLFYTHVPDVHAAADRVKAAGGQVINGPMEIPGGDWIVHCTDPTGAVFALHHAAAG